MLLTTLQEKLDAMDFVRFYGLSIQTLEPSRCVTKILYQKQLERPGGIVAGPTFMMAADVTFWLALVGELGIETPLVTANLHSTFLNPCREQDIWCEATIIKFGRRLIYGSAECRSERGDLFTHHTVTYARIIRD
jgi:acyl-coenzyme A thioesterase PaaI-like protein